MTTAGGKSSNVIRRMYDSINLPFLQAILAGKTKIGKKYDRLKDWGKTLPYLPHCFSDFPLCLTAPEIPAVNGAL